MLMKRDCGKAALMVYVLRPALLRCHTWAKKNVLTPACYVNFIIFGPLAFFYKAGYMTMADQFHADYVCDSQGHLDRWKPHFRGTQPHSKLQEMITVFDKFFGQLMGGNASGNQINGIYVKISPKIMLNTKVTHAPCIPFVLTKITTVSFWWLHSTLPNILVHFPLHWTAEHDLVMSLHPAAWHNGIMLVRWNLIGCVALHDCIYQSLAMSSHDESHWTSPYLLCRSYWSSHLGYCKISLK